MRAQTNRRLQSLETITGQLMTEQGQQLGTLALQLLPADDCQQLRAYALRLLADSTAQPTEAERQAMQRLAAIAPSDNLFGVEFLNR